MSETQYTVTDWQFETFGPTNLGLAFERLQKEYWELRDVVHAHGQGPDENRRLKCAEECADVLITLYRVAEMLRCDLVYEVDRKMAINRKRKWAVDEKGHGQHV